MYGSERLTQFSALSAAPLLSATLALLGHGHRLAHQRELALLRLEAHSEQVFDGLATEGLLFAGYDATMLVKHQVFLFQTSWCGSSS